MTDRIEKLAELIVEELSGSTSGYFDARSLAEAIDARYMPICNSINIRRPTIDDAGGMWELAKATSLDLNSSYSYLMMAEYFSDSCIVAIDQNHKVIGFVTGLLLRKQLDTIFIWQVAVDPDYRGQNIAGQMLNRLIEKTESKYLEATITHANKASITLFKRLAASYGAEFHTDKGFEEDDFPDDKKAEMLVQIGPLIAKEN